jgi:hypothetical protein
MQITLNLSEVEACRVLQVGLRQRLILGHTWTLRDWHMSVSGNELLLTLDRDPAPPPDAGSKTDG